MLWEAKIEAALPHKPRLIASITTSICEMCFWCKVKLELREALEGWWSWGKCWEDSINVEQHLPSPALPMGPESVEQRRRRSSLALVCCHSHFVLAQESWVCLCPIYRRLLVGCSHSHFLGPPSSSISSLFSSLPWVVLMSRAIRFEFWTFAPLVIKRGLDLQTTLFRIQKSIDSILSSSELHKPPLRVLSTSQGQHGLHGEGSIITVFKGAIRNKWTQS